MPVASKYRIFVLLLTMLGHLFQSSVYSCLANLKLSEPGSSLVVDSQLLLSVSLSLPSRDDQMLLTFMDDAVIFVVLAFLHVAVGFVLQRWNGSVRRWLEELPVFVRRAKPRFKKGVATKDVVINSNTHLSVRLFLPQVPSISCDQAAEEGTATTAQKLPVLIFFHGGGFMYCSPRLYAYDTFCRRLARMAGYLVVSVDYRRTPEVSFPVPFLDAIEAVAWVAKQTGCEAMQADGAEAAVAARLAQLGGKGGAEMIESLCKGRFVPPDADKVSDPLVEKVVNMEGMIGRGSEPWLSTHGDPTRVLIMGDSAGGNVVHNTMLLYLQAFAPFFSGSFVPPMSPPPVLRPEHGDVQGVAGLGASADVATWAGEAPPPPPASLRTVNMFGLNVKGNVLLYPFFGSQERQSGEIRNRYNLTFNMVNTDLMWRLILPKGATRDHYISNPGKLEDKSLLALFPPSLVVVSSEDILHDHGVAYHRLMRSREAGFSDCKILRFESVHDFVVIFPHLRDTERCFGALFYFMEAHK